MTAEVIRKHKKNKGIIKNLILVLIVIGLAIVPLFVIKDGKFAGADDRAEKAVNQINANYKPWFSPVFEPKSGEVETFFFALQAAIGSGIVFYALGYMRGRKKREEAADNDIH